MADARTMHQKSQFALITAGHHFLIKALPLREPDSRDALQAFIESAQVCQLSPAEIDAVLIRCLAVLNDYTDGRLPSLVDRYISGGMSSVDGPVRFGRCVEDVLRHRGVGDGLVRQALDIVSRSFRDPALRQREVARTLGVRLATLCTAFKRETGLTMGEHIRAVRLDAAATLLVTTNRSVKETWTYVGYNHPSNFGHDFKQRFHVSPGVFRARGIRPLVQPRDLLQPVPVVGEHGHSACRSGVLVVDDDPFARDMVAAHLERSGYSVSCASTAAAGLRAIATGSPAVVLLDYRLPDMDGIEFLKLLRLSHPGARPSAALLTADWDLFDRAEEVKQLDAVIVSKLCDLEQVRRLVISLSSANHRNGDCGLVSRRDDAAGEALAESNGGGGS